MTKEKFSPDNIPGVARGKDFFNKGKSIEATRETWASRKRALLLEDRLDLLLIGKNKESYFNSLAVLGRVSDIAKPAAAWLPRVDKITGAVVTSRIVSDFDRTLLSKGEYIAIAGKRFSTDLNLASIPKSWTISLLIPQIVSEGIEAAMRQQDEIVGTYRAVEGAEYGRVEEIFTEIHILSETFVRGEIKSENDLQVLAKRTQAYLVRNGLMDTEHPVWKKITNYTLKAAGKDSLNRLNPTVSRVLARAAYLAAVDREIAGINTNNKAQRIFSYLEGVRASTRFKIEESVNLLNELCGFEGRVASNQIFRDGKTSTTPQEIKEIDQVIDSVSESLLKKVEPAPYLLPATMARALLTGAIYWRGKNEAGLMLKIMKAGSFDEKQFQLPARHYLRNLQPLVAREVIRQAHSLLKSVLEDKTNLDVKVF